MPSTRFGYLLYPLALLAWAPALHRPATHRRPRPDHRPGRATSA